MLWNLLFCHRRTNFNRIFMVLRVGFYLWMFSNERLPLSRAFRRVLYFSERWLEPELWAKNLCFFFSFLTFKSFKDSSILLITRVVGIAQKSNNTLWKALDNGNLSLENIQNWNPTLKTIQMQLKLVQWWQKSNFQSIFLYYVRIHVFLGHTWW